MQRIPPFHPGRRLSAAHLTQIAEAVNDLQIIRTDGLVTAEKLAGTGMVLGLNVEGLLPLIPKGLRQGVAQIDSNDGAGAYTITEQVWDSGASAWIDVADVVGYVDEAARDFQDRDSAEPDDYVLFWEQEQDDGQLELLIDIAGIGLRWGKATAAWAAGNTVTLDPCESEAAGGADIPNAVNVTGHIISPTTGDPADDELMPEIALNDILAYLPFGTNQGVIVNVKWVLNPTTAAITLRTAQGSLEIKALYKGTDDVLAIAIAGGNWRGRHMRYWAAAVDGVPGGIYEPDNAGAGLSIYPQTMGDYTITSQASNNGVTFTVRIDVGVGTIEMDIDNGPGVSRQASFYMRLDYLGTSDPDIGNYTAYGNGL